MIEIFIISLLITQQSIEAKPCDDPQTQHQMNACAYEEYQTADKQLNTQWKITHDYMKSLDKDHEDDGRIGYAEALLKAQKSWIAFRDNHCLSESYRFRGGTAEPLLRYGCLAAETKRRTKVLVELTIEG